MAGDKKIPDWILKQRTLRRDVVVWPLATFHVLPMGAYGAVRTDPAHGWCPYKGHRKKDADPEREAKLRAGDFPCTHYGADLSAPKGSKVFAPHDGWILYSGVATKAPFVGYGPGAILIAHHDVQDSVWERGWKWATGRLLDIFDFPEGQVATRYSLLGHVDPLPVPPAVAAKLPSEITPVDMDLPEHEQPIPMPPDLSDSLSTKPNPDHWRHLSDGTVVMMSGADAVTQTKKEIVKRWVNAGDLVGHVSAANHVHWEIRVAPLAGHEGRIDPIAVWQQAYDLALPSGAEIAPPPPRTYGPEYHPELMRPGESGGGGGALLLLGAALAFGHHQQQSARRRRTRR